MLAVRLPESEAVSLLNEQISLAAVNAPSLCVVSGPADAIGILEARLVAAQRRMHGASNFARVFTRGWWSRF